MTTKKWPWCTIDFLIFSFIIKHIRHFIVLFRVNTSLKYPSKSMETNPNTSQKKHPPIPDELKRAKYWANLLAKAIDKHEIYIIAKRNLDDTNNNSIKQEKAKKILEKAIKKYEDIYNR
jgi:hypothetical protein